MKTNILKTTAMLLVLIGGSSCEWIADSHLSGMYIQTYPNEYEPRIKINFIDDERLEIIRQDVTDEFIYCIQGSSIILTTVTYKPEITTELYFRVINSSKFEIEFLNYYVMIGLAPPNMIFEKEN
ncbi:MAG: hypothetical protein LBV74_12205 [Tannerella sp.]|jgi:hypothetical protein|nr:hypothetical protein [Tannerella sp.]